MYSSQSYGAMQQQSYCCAQLQSARYSSSFSPMTAYSGSGSRRSPEYVNPGTQALIHSDPGFLKPERPLTKFIGSAAEVQEYVKEAFKATMNRVLPSDIQISVLDDKEFDKAHLMHDGIPSSSVQGFSVNRNSKGINEVFARANNLDMLMLTIGHEIGHVLTNTLGNEQDEEAKAFAFSLAWMENIRRKNIAGIASCIAQNPAQNGIHDTAFEFVKKIIREGRTAIEAFKQIAKGVLSIKNQLEVIILEA